MVGRAKSTFWRFALACRVGLLPPPVLALPCPSSLLTHLPYPTLPPQDNADLPCATQGWSPERSQRLGGALLEAVLAVAPNLR